MGPSRTSKHTSTSGGVEASSSKAYAKQQPQKKFKSRPKRPHSDDMNAGTALPGVQKLKAALRQTRRLLAKEKLAADVRVATERKQRALEADLAKAETARKERALAQKYHKIKFFERQKTLRRLKQAKKRLEECTDKKEQKRLENELFDARIDLNYIMHYPKLKKYISLYPPEVRKQDSKGKSKSEDGEEVDASAAETDRQRAELRKQIRECMQNGELSLEPETEAGDRPRPSSHSHTHGEDRTKSRAQPAVKIEADAFFGEESEDEGEDMDED